MRGLDVILRLVMVVALAILATGCSSLRYYGHVAKGQVELLAARRPIAAIVADPNADATLRRRLGHALEAREFASEKLGLPRNRSYTSYVDLGRPYVTWNVFATPEFSVDPIVHCFPFAGCVAYQGYFERALAEQAARRLAAEGDDTRIDGAVAYSTLGWFADPILSSMMRWSDDELYATIFHELAHQALYVKGDTAFNESFATFVQEQGLREWHAAHGDGAPIEIDRDRDDAFARLVLDLRDRLRKLYAKPLAVDAMRTAKQSEFAGFRRRYAQLRATPDWNEDHRYDAWVAGLLNNASLLPFGLYDRWVAAFAQLFRDADDDWTEFFRRSRELADTPMAERERELLALQHAGAIQRMNMNDVGAARTGTP